MIPARQGYFNENVYQLKGDLFVSPDPGLMNDIPCDISRTLGTNIRFRRRVSQGNDIEFVYWKNWKRRWDPVSRFVPLGERSVFRVTLRMSL